MTKRRRAPRTFGTVRPLASKRWQVRYHDAAGERHTGPHTFATKADADAWLAKRQTEMALGDNTDPRKGRLTFKEWSDKWQRDAWLDLKPRTVDTYESSLRVHVVPAFGKYAIADIDVDRVQEFVSRMSRNGASPRTVRNAYRAASGVFKYAVKLKALNSNPAAEVSLPRPRKREMVFIDAAEVEALAHAIANPAHREGEHHPEDAFKVRWAFYTGMRAGEIYGLRVRHVNLLQRTVRVEETTVVARAGVLEGEPVKTDVPRTIKIPRFLADELAVHLGDRAKERNALVFPRSDGSADRHDTWYKRTFKKAVDQAGINPKLRFHDLRHSCVSMMSARGVPIHAISRHVGHSSIQITMDTYAHVLGWVVDDLTDAMDAAYAAAVTDSPAPAEVRPMRAAAP